MTISYHTSPPTIITAHQSLSIRYYPLPPFCTHRSQEDDDDEEDFIPTDNGQTKLGKPKLPYLSYNRQLTKNQTHSAPILVLSLSPTIPSSSTSGPSSSKAIFDSAAEEQEKTLLATGSSDGVVKVWDVIGGFVTHVYKGHGGGVSALSWRFLSPQGEIREDEEEQTGGYMNAPSSSSRGISEGGKVMQLITGSVDTRIRVFDLLSRDPASKPIHVLEGHVSVVRGIDVDLTSEQGERGRWMITAGRDRVVFLWDFSCPVQGGKKISTGGKKSHGNVVAGVPRVVQTTMTNELIESVGFVSLPSLSVLRGSEEGRRASLVAFTGGEKGVVRVWDVQRGAELGRMDGPGGLGEDEDEEDEDEVEERGIREVL
jgi:U3 small nucleolar RNA-associated protein 13